MYVSISVNDIFSVNVIEVFVLSVQLCCVICQFTINFYDMLFYLFCFIVSERMMAAKNPLSLTDRPHQLFADAPPPQQPPAPSGGVAPPPPPPVQQIPGQTHMPGKR